MLQQPVQFTTRNWKIYILNANNNNNNNNKKQQEPATTNNNQQPTTNTTTKTTTNQHPNQPQHSTYSVPNLLIYTVFLPKHRTNVIATTKIHKIHGFQGPPRGTSTKIPGTSGLGSTHLVSSRHQNVFQMLLCSFFSKTPWILAAFWRRLRITQELNIVEVMIEEKRS